MARAILSMKAVRKEFPGVVALGGIDLEVNAGEILGLVGENGAGKSTLMKVLIGLQRPDAGEIVLRGRRVQLDGPEAAIRSGIGMVFQEGSMIPNLTVAENLFLAHEDGFRRWGLLSGRAMAAAARAQLAEVRLDSLDPAAVMGALPAAEKQMVEIARLLWLSARYGVTDPILILDEPTTVLQEREAALLFEILATLKQRASIIFISHRLEEVVRVSDRIAVMKDGLVVGDLPRGRADVRSIELLMVGHELAEEHYKESLQKSCDGEPVLEVRGLGLAGRFGDVHFELCRGEIVSLVGLLGSGKEEVCRCLAGWQRPDVGTILVHGREAHFASPQDAIAAGIGCVPIDRRNEGLATSLPVSDNINLLVLDELRRGPLLSPRRERENAERWVRECRIKTSSLTASCANLSGGNQQKVVIAKWLAGRIGILILDHPTRGIDVGAKEEIYRRIRELATAGVSMLIMCDTLEEDIGLANRMIVLKDGRIVREIACPPESKPAPVDVIGYIV